MAETRNIVFLGASYAGLSSSHYFLKHISPNLPSDSNIRYQVLVIDPSSKFFGRHTSPRALVRPDLIPIDKVFVDIEPAYKQYGDKVKFVQGKATSWDEKARNVTISMTNGKTESIDYWALILATGSKTYSPLYSLQGNDYKDVESAFKTIHGQISSAKDIVVVGGGAAGVETAGELGEFLNGAAGWFASRPSSPKVNVTLITSASKLLPELREAIAKQAEQYLNRVGVDVRYNTKVFKNETTSDGKIKVVLHDGEEMHADIVIPAMGVQPMSDYVPAHLKNAKGYVVQNDSTLRVDAAGPRVYAVGDIGTYSNDSIFAIMQGVPVMESNLKRDLLAAHSEPTVTAKGQDRLYEKPSTTEMQIVPVGLSKGVGAVFGWRLPSIFTWLIKGRDFMISTVQVKVSGSDQVKEDKWKGAA